MDSEPVIGIDPIVARLKTASQNAKIICLGERHDAPLQERFGARMVLEIDGLTHLVLEGKREYQPLIDDFMATGQIGAELRNLLGIRTDDFFLILEEAKKKGLRVIVAGEGVDPNDKVFFDVIENEIGDYERKTGGPAKALVYFGSWHVQSLRAMQVISLGILLQERYGKSNVYLVDIASCGIVKYNLPLCTLENAIVVAGLVKESVGVFDLVNVPLGNCYRDDVDTEWDFFLLKNLYDAVIYIYEDSYFQSAAGEVPSEAQGAAAGRSEQIRQQIGRIDAELEKLMHQTMFSSRLAVDDPERVDITSYEERSRLLAKQKAALEKELERALKAEQRGAVVIAADGVLLSNTQRYLTAVGFKPENILPADSINDAQAKIAELESRGIERDLITVVDNTGLGQDVLTAEFNLTANDIELLQGLGQEVDEQKAKARLDAWLDTQV